jgi:thioesterase domain-containing protein
MGSGRAKPSPALRFRIGSIEHMPTPQHSSTAQRVAALSPAKRRLLALRAGATTPAPEAARSVVAFVGTPAGAAPESLRRFAAEQLPHYMVPARFVVLPAMPRTPNGKVDHAALRQAAREQGPAPRAETAPAPAPDEVEGQLRALWSELLGVGQVGPHDDFFALGGHSLLAVRMLARVKAELGYDIPVALIVESPTIARLAGHIRTTSALAPAVAKMPVERVPAQKAAHRIITPIQPHGTLTPLFFLPLHMHGALHYRHLKERLGVDRPLYGFAGFSAAPGAIASVETLAAEYVDALLTFQPRGPYYLAGISVAGLLAFEMARQLNARHVRDVAPILFDTWGPGYPRRLPAHQALMRAPRQFVGGSSISPATRALDLLAQPLEKAYAALKILRATARRSSVATNGVHHDESNADPNLHLQYVDEALGAITAAYLNTPHPYAGSLTLFRAAIQPWNAHDDITLGWSSSVAGGVFVEHVRGDHLGMLRRRYVGGLAIALARRLEYLDRTLGSAAREG